MEYQKIYCPVVGECPYFPVQFNQNSFFLIQAFDEDKKLRENTIDKALKKFYGKNNYQLVTADREITLKGLYCDICKKIQSCPISIVDITPKKIGEKFYIKENVMLELGLAFGLRKPVLIISQKIDKKRYIPSDLGFIRYIDNSCNIQFENWKNLQDKLIDILSGIGGLGYIQRKIPTNLRLAIKENIKNLKVILNSIKYQDKIDELDIKVHQFRLDNGYVIAIIDGCSYFENGMQLKLMEVANGVESYRGILEIYHIQKNTNIAQAYCYYDKKYKNELETLEKQIVENDNCLSAYPNRLYLYVDDELKRMGINKLKIKLKIGQFLIGKYLK